MDVIARPHSWTLQMEQATLSCLFWAFVLFPCLGHANGLLWDTTCSLHWAARIPGTACYFLSPACTLLQQPWKVLAFLAPMALCWFILSPHHLRPPSTFSFFPQLSSHPHLPHSGFCRWFCELNCKISPVHLVKIISAHPSKLDWERVAPDSILEGVL